MDGQMSRDRLASAAAVALLHALLVYALLIGLGVRILAPESSPLKLFDIAPEAPPPPPPEAPPPRARNSAPREAAAPPALKAEGAPIVAPPPLVRIEVPPPLPAAPVAGTGGEISQGVSDRVGPGTGSGGEGNGTGGGAGDGMGADVDTGGPPVRTRRIRGYFTDRVYPI